MDDAPRLTDALSLASGKRAAILLCHKKPSANIRMNA